MKRTIDGITYNTDNLTEAFEKEFEIIRDDEDKFFALSNEEFLHDDEEMSFKYKYAIVTYYFEEGQETYLTLVPSPGSLCKECYDSVMSYADIIDYEMVEDYGYGIIMMRSQEEDARYDMANIYKTVDSLRGFYLDRLQNRIGSTGWDLLDHALLGRDYIKAALERYAKGN